MYCNNKTGNAHINVTLMHIHVTIAVMKKKKSITYSECVFVALGIQRAIHKHHTVFCGLSGLLDFSMLPHKWQDLGGGGSIEQKMCFDFLYKSV